MTSTVPCIRAGKIARQPGRFVGRRVRVVGMLLGDRLDDPEVPHEFVIPVGDAFRGECPDRVMVTIEGDVIRGDDVPISRVIPLADGPEPPAIDHAYIVRVVDDWKHAGCDTDLGPGPTPSPSDYDGLVGVLQGAARGADRCLSPQGAPPSVHVRITFAAVGVVTEVVVDDPPELAASIRSCLETLLRTVRLQPFANGPITVGKVYRHPPAAQRTYR